MDWLCKFLRLPQHFLHTSFGPGGGIIQGSASESILVAVLAAREQGVRRYKAMYPHLTEAEIRGKLIAYSSDQSNSCVEKAGLLAAVQIKLLPTGDDFRLTGKILENAVNDDLQKGLFPIICIATLGTTGTCAFDDIQSLGPICDNHKIWLHVDAAYAGVAFPLEEYSFMLSGLEFAESLNFNLHKSLLVNFDCTAMWLRDANLVVDSFNVDRIYLKHQYEGLSKIPDFRHWQIPLGRRFRALKVWITLRAYGQEGLLQNIQKRIQLSEKFENYLISEPDHFEIITKRSLGLVCFRMKGDNELNTKLIKHLTDMKKLYMVQGKFKDTVFIRFCICGMQPTEEDVDYAWNEIKNTATKVRMDYDDFLNGNYIENLNIK